jgi:Transcription factor TFIIH complex subunit Tfb5
MDQGSSDVVISSGTLITTDIPTKQLIVYLNEQNEHRIIIQDLDDTHVLIDPRYLDYVTTECERLHEQNVFERKQ